MELSLQILFALGAVCALAAVAVRASLRPAWRETLTLTGYTLFTVAVTGLWRAPTRLFLAGEDPTIEVWMLMRVSLNLLRHPWDPYVGNLGYPEPHSILFSDPLASLAALVTPLRLFTDNGALVYNVALLLALTLTAYAFYRLALRLTSHPGAAIVAGLVVAFMPQQVHRLYLGALSYVALAGFAFLILGLIRLLERPSFAAAACVAGAFVFQASIGGYWALFSTLVALLVAAWGWRAFRSWNTWACALLAAALATLALWPYLAGMVEIARVADLRREGDWAEKLVTDLALHPIASYSYLWHSLTPEPLPPGGRLFPGLITLGFAGLGVWRWRDRVTGLLLLLGSVFLVLSFGTRLTVAGHVFGPAPLAWLREHLPFFGSIRTPITFAVITVACLAVLAARGIAATPCARRPWVGALLIAGVAAELLSPPPRLEDRGDAHVDVYASLAQLPRGAALHIPLDVVPEVRWAATVHEQPMANLGGFGFTPHWWRELERLVRKEWLVRPAHQDMQDWRSTRLLRVLPIRYLIVRPNTSGYLASHIEATRATFAPLGSTARGYRLFRIRRGDVGRRFRRLFGDDELRSGPLVAWLRGPEGAHLTAELNGVALAPVTLTRRWHRQEWSFAPQAIRRGSNELRLALEGDGQGDNSGTAAALELYDIGSAALIDSPPTPGPL